MSEGIFYLLILVCVVGWPWLAMVIMTKAKRRRKWRSVERGFANHFPPIAPQRPPATSRTQIATKPVTIAGQKCELETARVGNPVRALLPPEKNADPIQLS